MSAPEPGSVSSENLVIQRQPLLPQPAAINHPLSHAMQLSYTVDGTAVYKPVAGNSTPPYGGSPAGNGNGAAVASDGIDVNMRISGGSGGGGGGVEQVKKRRGRPRKYGPDGSVPVPLNSAPPVVGGYLSPKQPSQSHQHHHQEQQQPAPQSHHHHQQSQQQQQQHGVVQGGAVPESQKRRGRPPGSSNKKQHQHQKEQQFQQEQQQLDALGSPGIGFTPHVITVNTGEDVSSKIMSFSQNGPRAICILSANGTIQSVTLRQAATSGSSVTYEGRFEILSLSGSFMLSESGGGSSRSSGLSVSLAGPDGRVLGGGVAGLLTAASPVQVVVGSFIADGRRELKVPNQSEPLFTPSRLHSVTGQPGTNSPPSRGTLSESSGGPGSPLHQSAAAVNSNPPGMSILPWK